MPLGHARSVPLQRQGRSTHGVGIQIIRLPRCVSAESRCADLGVFKRYITTLYNNTKELCKFHQRSSCQMESEAMSALSYT